MQGCCTALAHVSAGVPAANSPKLVSTAVNVPLMVCANELLILTLCLHTDGSRVEVHRISVAAADVHVLGKTAADGAMDSSRQSWTTTLEEQAAWSSAEAEPDAETVLPKWSCRLGSQQEVEQLCERMTSLCTAPLAQVTLGRDLGLACFFLLSACVQPHSSELTFC